jgi:hypothetical protein
MIAVKGNSTYLRREEEGQQEESKEAGQMGISSSPEEEARAKRAVTQDLQALELLMFQ